MNNNSNIWGKKVIEKALQYANYKWTASEKNVMHGIDENGRFVDTPDITWKGETLACGWWEVGKVNVGIPYGWGNASTLEEFEICGGFYMKNYTQVYVKFSEYLKELREEIRKDTLKKIGE